jgi:inosose dehydratase
VHLKDVDGALADEVAAGRIGFADAVRAGLFLPLGRGSADVAAMVSVLEDRGYAGWYVLEQDIMLDAEPTGEGSAGEGPVANVRVSLDYLEGFAA